MQHGYLLLLMESRATVGHQQCSRSMKHLNVMGHLNVIGHVIEHVLEM